MNIHDFSCFDTGYILRISPFHANCPNLPTIISIPCTLCFFASPSRHSRCTLVTRTMNFPLDTVKPYPALFPHISPHSICVAASYLSTVCTSGNLLRTMNVQQPSSTLITGFVARCLVVARTLLEDYWIWILAPVGACVSMTSSYLPISTAPINFDMFK